MPHPDPETWPVRIGRRLSLRRRLADGGQGDLVGFLVAVDAAGLTVRDRRGRDHAVPRSDVLALRAVGVARGRDPLRTPRAELDRLAAAAGASGRAFVVRLCDLLDARDPEQPGAWADPPPEPLHLDREWATIAEPTDLFAAAWWAAYHDARSLQVRTGSAEVAAELVSLRFGER